MTGLTLRAEQLLAYLSEKAELGGVCPNLGHLAARLDVTQDNARTVLKELRDAKHITWRRVYCGAGQGNVRVVRIVATGKETGTPAMTGRRASLRGRAKPPPPFTPTEYGCPVRRLVGPEFDYWRGIYEAREAASAQRQMARA